MKYGKILKWVLGVLFIVGVLLSLVVFIPNPATSDAPFFKTQFYESLYNARIDIIIVCAYLFAALTLLAVVFGVIVIGGMNNPKSLIKLLIVFVAGGALVAGAYFLAPGTPIESLTGATVTDTTLKLTDTCLILTYVLFGGAILSLAAGWIVGLIRK